MTRHDQSGASSLAATSLAASLPLSEVVAILASDARSALDGHGPRVREAEGRAPSDSLAVWLGLGAIAAAVGSLSLLMVLPVV